MSRPLCWSRSCSNSATLRCTQCREALYCSPECQRVHWKAEHRQSCKFLLPINSSMPVDKCSVCLSGDGRKTFICSICRAVRYCSEECQLKNWQSHSNICRPLEKDFLPVWKRVMLYCQLLPPDVYRGANQEQDFWMPIGNLRPDSNRAGWYMADGNVKLNRVRLAKGVKKSWEVPVMLHYEESKFRVTAMTKHNMIIWSSEVSYALNPVYFEHAPLARGWTRISADKIHLTKSIEDIATETWIHGETRQVIFDGESGMSVMMNITRTTQPSGEALTFYMDRIWALTGIIIYLPKSTADLIREYI